MDLADLRIFQTVVREGGVTRAAEKLHRVQSNITTRIKQLEQELGVQLFIREGKRLTVSPQGTILANYAERILQLADEARAIVNDIQPHGQLRLGSMESTAATRLPPILAQFHALYPEVKLELRTSATGRLRNEVLEGRLDCALVAAPVNDDRLASQLAFEEELVLVAPAGHAPIQHPTDIKTRSMLTFEAGCVYRQRLESWLTSSGVAAERIIELSSYHAMLGCAAAGMGIALVPRSLIQTLPSRDTVSVHRLPSDIARTTTLLVYRKGFESAAVKMLGHLISSAPADTP